jgi:hypothetical protein
LIVYVFGAYFNKILIMAVYKKEPAPAAQQKPAEISTPAPSQSLPKKKKDPRMSTMSEAQIMEKLRK